MLNENCTESLTQELKEIQNWNNNSIAKSLSVKEKGILSLDFNSINALKAKERQAAQVLIEVGIREITWYKCDAIVKNFICPIENCSGKFSELYLLKNHFFKAHNCRPYKCDYNNCKWSFANKSKLERHKNSHLNMKWFRCLYETCNKMFTTLYNLRQHLRSVHEKAEQFICGINDCDAAFHNQRSLDLHKATHQNTEPSYSCDQEGCDKTFVTRNALCSHMRSHDRKLEDLKCTWEGCNKVFDVPCRLRAHTRMHTGEKPYKCDHPGCGWSFYSGSKLHRHRNKHLQIRKFVCCINYCNKSFLRSQHLKEHILRHSKTDTKDFACPISSCDSRFSSKNLVYRHVKKVHRQSSVQEADSSNDVYKANDSELPTQQQNSIGQLDTATLLTSDYDVCSGENVPLTAHLPELMPSELLVAMTAIDSTNNESLVDINCIETSSNSESLVEMSPNTSEALIINDASVRLIINDALNSKSSRKHKALSSARTNYTYDDVIREKSYRSESESNGKNKWHLGDKNCDDVKTNKKGKTAVITNKQTEDLSQCKMSIPPDLVLGAAGMSDPHSLIIKDELYTQEDLQVLLLDQNTSRHSIFEPSTINLRDLE